MKNGWVKIFPGEYLAAPDGESISWSKTRMQGLCGLMLHHNHVRLELICGPGEYHYSEDYEVTVGENNHEMVARRIEFFNGKYWEIKELNTKTMKVSQYQSEQQV